MRWLLAVCLLCGLAHAETRTGYRNGRAFRINVVTVDSAEVEVSTARAFAKMRAAAEHDGVKLWIWSGFRSNERQAELYQSWRAKEGNLAAKPGYSNHQSGSALDIALSFDGAYAWLEKHARRYGFKRTVPGEPWHWEYAGRSVVARSAGRPKR